MVFPAFWIRMKQMLSALRIISRLPDGLGLQGSRGEELHMERKMKIMIVEDDAALAREISSFLTKWGYEAYIAERFEDIAGETAEQSPQLVLLDINLPFYDGFYWCRRIRQITKLPIIYISSRNDDRDKIMGIAQGGDDYVEKPFHLELLRAKMEAVLRRTYEYRVREQTALTGSLLYDSGDQTLCYHGEQVELTKSERIILHKLVDSRPLVVTREELMMELWDTDEYVSDGTLTTVISRLRSKLRSTCNEEIIQTRKGQGYYII